MKDKRTLASQLARRLDLPDPATLVAAGGSALNTLLLAVFRKRLEKLSASELLRLYRSNRHVQPAATPVLRLREQECAALRHCETAGFDLVELSPAAQLGSCSVLGTVNQDKILSALRNCEVMADATNALALYDAARTQQNDAHTRNYASVSRLLRTPPDLVPGHSPHFSVACLVSAAKDPGNFVFETDAVIRHVRAIRIILTAVFGFTRFRCGIIPLQGEMGHQIAGVCLRALSRDLPDVPAELREPDLQQQYYRHIRFKADVWAGGCWKEVADGGLVDWAAKLLGNSKQRMFTSGLGLEYLYHLGSHG
ncbi:hypothetical protein C7T94_08005 [Pedobacter yulinensis]|uniref:Uncharacterized protein n=1 Tax=Pedobacter yulinensis TaxID=2126353 RepID=A0A2T3HJI7_9SPHI|nr:hypothetical protein [Pedobacter yulinensis]PST82600.1 hypothetical protein C7T94_08005 [Pedobacter yulinensis]